MDKQSFALTLTSRNCPYIDVKQKHAYIVVNILLQNERTRRIFGELHCLNKSATSPCFCEDVPRTAFFDNCYYLPPSLYASQFEHVAPQVPKSLLNIQFQLLTLDLGPILLNLELFLCFSRIALLIFFSLLCLLFRNYGNRGRVQVAFRSSLRDVRLITW